MNACFDIHTHRLPDCAGQAIVSCEADDFHPLGGQFYSVGLHPWHLTADFVADGSQARRLAEVCRHPQVVAVGEAGLDKLKSPVSLEQQMETFRFQAVLAEEVDKPLVIHQVKAVDELLQMRRKIHPHQPWIIHGFRGNSHMAAQLLHHGFYLSFGEWYSEEALRVVPLHRLFLETDESALPVQSLYMRAAVVRQMLVDDLCRAVQENVERVFRLPR